MSDPVRRNWLARGFDTLLQSPAYPWIERLADTPIPRPLRPALQRSFARLFGIDASEADRPLAAFHSFSALFTRRLAPGRRPQDPDPRALLSPADGLLEAHGEFAPGDDPEVRVKGVPVRVGTLLGGFGRAAAPGGRWWVVYLSPRDYHRVHWPAAGRLVAYEAIPGGRYPVNPLGRAACPEVLFRNERLVAELRLDDGAPLFLVLVAAFGVSRIGAAFAAPEQLRRAAGAGPVRLPEPIPVARGDEAGLFDLGSTVVLILPRSPIPVESRCAPGPVRVGQALARRGGSLHR